MIYCCRCCAMTKMTDDGDGADCIAFSTGHYGARKGSEARKKMACMRWHGCSERGMERGRGGGRKALLALVICGKHPARRRRAGKGEGGKEGGRAGDADGARCS